MPIKRSRPDGQSVPDTFGVEWINVNSGSLSDGQHAPFEGTVIVWVVGAVYAIRGNFTSCSLGMVQDNPT